jgi:hypothetical protein
MGFLSLTEIELNNTLRNTLGLHMLADMPKLLAHDVKDVHNLLKESRA